MDHGHASPLPIALSATGGGGGALVWGQVVAGSTSLSTLAGLIVPVACALIAGGTAYLIQRRKERHDQKLVGLMAELVAERIRIGIALADKVDLQRKLDIVAAGFRALETTSVSTDPAEQTPEADAR